MNMPRRTKLYAYVDESGQDTKGRLFVVATAIIPAEEQERTRQLLERIERSSGKDKKWTKSKVRQRQAYMEQVLHLPVLHERVFYTHFEHTTNYLPCVLHTISGAVRTTVTGYPYKVTVLIDGLQQSVRHEVARSLRRRQVDVRNVRGINEKNDALMRLADAMAGLTRHAIQERPYAVTLFDEAQRRGIIREL